MANCQQICEYDFKSHAMSWHSRNSLDSVALLILNCWDWYKNHGEILRSKAIPVYVQSHLSTVYLKKKAILSCEVGSFGSELARQWRNDIYFTVAEKSEWRLTERVIICNYTEFQTPFSLLKFFFFNIHYCYDLKGGFSCMQNCMPFSLVIIVYLT